MLIFYVCAKNYVDGDDFIKTVREIFRKYSDPDLLRILKKYSTGNGHNIRGAILGVFPNKEKEAYEALGIDFNKIGKVLSQSNLCTNTNYLYTTIQLDLLKSPKTFMQACYIISLRRKTWATNFTVLIILSRFEPRKICSILTKHTTGFTINIS